MIPIKDSNPCTCFPIVTIGLVVANLLVFGHEILLGPQAPGFIRTYGFVPADLLQKPQTLISSMFIHGGVLHIVGNMLYLWIFGDNIESAFGHIRFLMMYVFFGVVGTLAHALSGPGSTVPMVGASGAVAGVLGAYILLYPRARVLTVIFFGFFVRLIWIPAVWVLGLWIVLQVIQALPGINRGASDVAFFAHVGGFAVGVLVALPSMRRVRARCTERRWEEDESAGMWR